MSISCCFCRFVFHNLGIWDPWINKVKNGIETKGFTQIIQNVTRSWNQQNDSILDHIWLNCKDRLVNFTNEVRASSDHNVITCGISQEKINEKGHNILKRSWKKFNTEHYKNDLKNVDWTPLYRLENVELASDFLTEKIKWALDRSEPLKRIQPRRGYKNWLSDNTKSAMVDRDRARELARTTKLETDWRQYRQKRNICTKLQTRDKKQYESGIFEEIAEKKDTKRLFMTTRKMLNWKTGGPPTKFLIGGKLWQKAEKVANLQMEYFTKKLIRIRSSLGTSEDPLRLLSGHMKDGSRTGKFRNLK